MMKRSSEGTSQASRAVSLSSSSSKSKNKDHDDDDEDVVVDKGSQRNPSSKNNNGVSSSSSTIEGNKKSTGKGGASSGGGGGGGGGSVRQYVRSKTSRLRWTPDLHLCFIHAVERLGGQERATPKLVLQMMNVKGISIAHVKSHLQMYRSKKIEEPNQVHTDQGFYMEGGDNHVYNLSQLSMLQSLNHQWPSNSGLLTRYGADASWRGRHDHRCHHRHQIYSPYNNTACRTQLFDHHSTRVTGIYGSVAERIFGSNNTSTSTTTTTTATALNNIPSTWRSTHQISTRVHRDELRPPFNRQSWQDHHINATRNIVNRKAPDCDDNDNSDLDLNLSLKVPAREENKVLGFGLSLSLSPSSPSSSKQKLEENGGDDDREQHGRKASTLDLTL